MEKKAFHCSSSHFATSLLETQFLALSLWEYTCLLPFSNITILKKEKLISPFFVIFEGLCPD